MSAALRLDSASVEAIAHRVADLLGTERAEAGVVAVPELIDAAEVARRFSVTRSYVYEHSVELGALHLGEGLRPRLRFDAAIVAERLTLCSTSRESARPAEPIPGPKTRTPRKRTTGAERPLLPIRPPKVPK